MNTPRHNVAQQINDLLVAADCHQLQPVYAGIGSRRTPVDVLDLMTRIAKRLDGWGWTLRSGGADGADDAFNNGALQRPEIYLPWRNFRGIIGARLPQPTAEAMTIAAQHHPNWKNVYKAARSLFARNVHQVLGADCATPSAFVICWTPDGSTGETTSRTGGTGQAIRIAGAHRIPIFNLARQDHREAWEEAIR